MEKNKTDDSVKAGLQIEADKKPLRRKRKRIPLAGKSSKEAGSKEIDVDDVVHEPDFEPTAVFNKVNSELAGGNTEEKDADGRVDGK